MTLKDIALETGFSVITVSRVMRTPQKVKKKTREIIEEAIKKYNYKPNSLAQALVYRRTNIIYLYVPIDLEGTHPFVMQLIAGVGSYAGSQGYSVLMKREWHEDEPCDGVILVGLTIDDEARLLELNQRVPVVLFGHNEFVDFVDVDNKKGSYMMTDYVLNRGYRKIAYIGINQKKRFTKDRLMGHIEALKAHGINEEDTIQYFVDNKEVEGYEATLEILKKHSNVEAVICMSDYLAIGAFRAANKLGIQVPKDLGIAGFDGLGYELLTTPHLTTIRQPIYEVGELLVKRLLEKIKNSSTTASGKYFIPELIINETLK